MNIKARTIEELIRELDSLIPHRCPRPDEDEKRMWMYAGKRELIDELKHSFLKEGDYDRKYFEFKE